jgi:copper homeostasis protein
VETILEIATFTIDAAIAAFEAGASRIEVCDNPHDGGTTPSLGMLQVLRNKITIPMYPIVRPRGGHFVYSEDEYECMAADIELCKKLGFEGVVLGLLNSEGDVDLSRTKALVELASPMQVTFHRAFDRSKNFQKAIEDIIHSGCKRILTSGQFPDVQSGIMNLREIINLAGKRITIMPGSGLNSANIQFIKAHSGAFEFHSAARKTLMHHQYFSPSTMSEQLNYIGVDANEIQAMLRKLGLIE